MDQLVDYDDNEISNEIEDNFDAFEGEKAIENKAEQMKIDLNERRSKAADAAKLALAKKLRIIKELEKQTHEAETDVQRETIMLQNAQTDVNIAMNNARRAQTQFKTLTQAVQTAQVNLEHAEKATNTTEMDVIKKNNILKDTRKRLDSMMRQLSTAKNDYTDVKKAAYKAACAARDANNQAARKQDLQRYRRLGALFKDTFI